MNFTEIYIHAKIWELGIPKADTYELDADLKLYGQNYSSHPWKKRVYDRQFICQLTEADLDGLRKLAEKNKAKAEAKAKVKTAEKATYDEWVAGLPDEIEGLVVEKNWRVLNDEYGNFYLPLPSKPVANLAQWIHDNEYIPE